MKNIVRVDGRKKKKKGQANNINRRRNRIILGCIGFPFFFTCACCSSILMVDALCLYENLPFLPDVLMALGVPVGCTPAF